MTATASASAKVRTRRLSPSAHQPRKLLSMQKPDNALNEADQEACANDDVEVCRHLYRLWPQDDAVARGTCHGKECGLRVFQRVDRTRLDRERLEMLTEKARDQFAEHGAGRDRRQSK